MQVRIILWGALFMSTFIYLVVVQVVAPPTPAAPDAIIPIVLAAVSLGCAALSFVLPSRITRTALSALALPTEASPSFGDLPAGTRVFADSSRARAQAAPVMQTGFILRLALREAIALNGFVLAFMGHPPFIYLGFFALTWLLFALAFPRQAVDDAELEAAYDAKLR